MPSSTCCASSRGLDFSHYKRNTVLRRIERRMALHRVDDLTEYHPHSPGTIRRKFPTLYQDMLIRVTNFFRDPRAFEFLQQSGLPRPDSRPSRPTCRSACGSRAAPRARRSTRSPSPCWRPWETRPTPAPIKISRLRHQRVGPRAGSLRPVHREYRHGPLAGAAAAVLLPASTIITRSVQAIRDLCIFSRHDLTRDPPFAGLDLVSCRNVMIYLRPRPPAEGHPASSTTR